MGKWLVGKRIERLKLHIIKLILSLFLLATESLLAIYKFHVTATILWFTVPFTVYEFFMIVRIINIQMENIKAKEFRNISSLVYTFHIGCIEMLKFIGFAQYGMILFLCTGALSLIYAKIVYKLSQKIGLLKYLY